MNKLVLWLQWLLLIEHDLYMIYMSVRTSTLTSLLILFNTTQHNTLWLFTLLSCSTVSVLELNVLCLVRIGEAMTVWNTLNVQIHDGKMGHGGGAVWKVSIKILTHILFSFFRYISESPSGSMVTDVNPMLLELSSSAKKKKILQTSLSHLSRSLCSECFILNRRICSRELQHYLYDHLQSTGVTVTTVGPLRHWCFTHI